MIVCSISLVVSGGSKGLYFGAMEWLVVGSKESRECDLSKTSFRGEQCSLQGRPEYL